MPGLHSFHPRAILVMMAILLAFGAAPALAGENSDTCLGCHAESFPAGEKSTVLHETDSPHEALDCVGCHADAETMPHETKPGKVDCSTCHSDASDLYGKSVHGVKAHDGDTLAADCADCHGVHEIRRTADPQSKVYPLNLPATCGRCHNDTRMGNRPGVKVTDALNEYADSIHGKGLLDGGLVVSASCNDCHDAHAIQRSDSPESLLHRKNVASTCGKCHEGVVDVFNKSIHGQKLAEGDDKVPTCTTCHQSHQIQRGEAEEFQLQVLGGCGDCHTKQIETYRETYHGQVTALGFVAIAKCADCHEHHAILPSEDPASATNKANLGATCGKCHEGVNPKFIEFQAHGDPHDRENYPILFYTYYFMTTLLICVFTFFGIHTLLWLYRGLRERSGRTSEGG